MTSSNAVTSTIENSISTGQQLWNQLKRRNLVEGETPLAHEEHNHWYIRALQGFAGWIAGFFLLGFIGSLLVMVFDYENSLLLIFSALLGNGLAYTLAKNRKNSEFLQQMSLVFNLCGQLLFAWGLFYLVDSWSAIFFLSLLLYQSLVIYFIADYSSRLITTWFAMFALYASLAKLGTANLNIAIASSMFLIIWLRDTKWATQRDLWEPVGYGIALSLLQIHGQTISGEFFDWWYPASNYEWIGLTSFWLAELVLSGLLIYIFFTITRSFEIIWNTTVGWMIIGGLLLLLLARFYIPGIGAAVLLLLVGFMKQRRMLFMLGMIAFISFLSWYYYQLSLTLLAKSISLIVLGICFLIAYFLLNNRTLHPHVISSGRNHNGQAKNSKLTDDHFPEISDRKKWIAVGVSFLILLLVNVSIYQKENLLRDGQLVLLKLAPVDPRSIMQGDYMRLRFNIEHDFLPQSKEKDIQIKFDPKSSANEGIFIVSLDENQVGSYLAKNTDQPLETNQIKMQFRIRNNHLQLATHAFFFQEGTAKDYQKAVYGEFRVAQDGQLLLNNLRNKNFEVLGYNRPNN